MLFNEFPFEEKNEILLLNQIKSNICLKLCNNKFLDGLIKKMLIVNKDKRISWDEYLNHEFFKINHVELSNFNCICKTHLKYIQYYCINCNNNICEICAKEHLDEIHQMIILSQIGLTNEEEIKLEFY
jgi:serine/threonine protein kinase